ncbi:uncharacterized protein LOC578387 [Strongylocentrotus purpuratus]|uniref:Transcription factor Adf-1 n=1 Tax=Strongylocentrotus purpuratus TaxID=7668 RepID=A0A7M7GP12_STRPU|nr:uncharacterized protein LOC578387 [Strongylocentrotus purpuratus]|eukprot:XP_003724715.1 PREDICTED: uncharacterized protein LOC578387 [Strongylocentrotus purpuratus]
MSGTVLEVVHMKVEEEGEEHIEAAHLEQSSRPERSCTRKEYLDNMDTIVEKQCVDEELIEEVKKNSCIYDPSHMYARDSFLKETTWREIASTLNVSTEYCKLRWKSLRDRFVKTEKEERRRRESGIHKLVKPYRFAGHLSFLRDYTRERRPGFLNYRDQQPLVTYVKDVHDEEQSTFAEDVRDDDEDREIIEAVEQGWATADGYISSASSHHTNSNNMHHHRPTNNVKHQSPRKSPRKRQHIPANEYVTNYLGLGAQDDPAAKRSTQSQSSSSTSEGPEELNNASLTGEDNEQKYDEVLHFLMSLAPAMRRLPTKKQSLARIKIQTVLHELEFSEN